MKKNFNPLRDPQQLSQEDQVRQAEHQQSGVDRGMLSQVGTLAVGLYEREAGIDVRDRSSVTLEKMGKKTQAKTRKIVRQANYIDMKQSQTRDKGEEKEW